MNLYNKFSYLIVANRRKGTLGEIIIKKNYQKYGFKILNSKKGCDFIAEKEIPGTTRIYREYVEVKTGCAKQTKTQKKTMARVLNRGCNYTVFHVSDAFLERYLEANGEVLAV